MTSHEIADQFAAAIAKANNALRNGWISKDEHSKKIAQAHSWKNKAEWGVWDHKAYKQGA